MSDMSNAAQNAIFPLLDSVIDPLSQRSLLSLDAISDIQFTHNTISLSVTLGYPSESIQKDISEQLWAALNTIDTIDGESVDKVNIDIGWQAPKNVNIEEQPLLNGVRNIIAVASGKGGVGKSTTSVNLALALAKLGAKVGILDADIYGPSQAMLLGIGAKRPEVREQKYMLPNEAYGVKSMSMAYLVTEQTPMVWRGPMATGALQQLLFQTDWQDLDYLFVDMPPGTGDIQLTLSQKVPVSGAVVVTTPQDIALLDAKKAIEMFNKVNVPIMGVVENMAVHQCSQCGHSEHIFGEGGGERIAKDYGTQLLGALPLALSIRADADSGKPSVVADPSSAISQQYIDIAQKTAAALWLQYMDSSAPVITISDD
ncbi:MAG: ATP-binding protein involved in chromosome partitioning [Candidatus Endobugula sp.]|jgi:ATP-binding protein involved in chromosome partitioning